MDSYNIFDDLSEENAHTNSSDREESFVDETPLEKLEKVSAQNEESEISETPFPVSDLDPLGIAGKLNTENTSHTNITNQSIVAMKFDLPEHSSIIKVIGVGGG